MKMQIYFKCLEDIRRPDSSVVIIFAKKPDLSFEKKSVSRNPVENREAKKSKGKKSKSFTKPWNLI
jgi:hypothetical protein